MGSVLTDEQGVSRHRETARYVQRLEHVDDVAGGARARREGLRQRARREAEDRTDGVASVVGRVDRRAGVALVVGDDDRDLLSATQIAVVLDTSEAAIRGRLRKAKLELRAALDGLARNPEELISTFDGLERWAAELRGNLVSSG